MNIKESDNMMGVWHCIISNEQIEMKYLFSIEENNGLKLSVTTEPVPIIVITETYVNGNHISAKGINQYFAEDQVSLELDFEQETFTGKLVLMGQEISLDGKKGRGEAMSESLIPFLAANRKVGLTPRSEAEINKEVERLLNVMSIEDKIGQMSQCQASNFSFGGDVESLPPEVLVEEGRAGSILGAFDIRRVYELQKIAVERSPHRIPLLFNADVIHGHQTIFPVPLAWSCSWDLDLIKQAAAIAAKEATVSGITYNHGPMVDVTRDPRWGRVVEGAGEDPYLGSLIAKAQVEGFQGDSLFNDETIIACLKHFIGYGASEGGRDYNTVDISEGTLRNFHLPPFRAGIEAGAGSVMNAFNIYQGIPAAGNKFLLHDLLRDELGFKGMLISDYGSIDEIHTHGVASDKSQAAAMALNATMDIEMVTQTYANELPGLIEKGIVKEEQLDEAVRRILTYKYRIGIMDDPYRYIQPDKEQLYHFHPDHVETSRELARKSIVLLKNNQILPLKPNQKIAVIGPFGISKDLLGPWQFSKYSNETVTLFQGIAGKGILAEQLVYAPGSDIDSEIPGGIEYAITTAEESDVVILALGESSNMSGEAASRTNISLPAAQMRLAEAIAATGKPVILVLTNGRPLELEWFDLNVDAIVETWFLGSQAGHAIADILFGDYNPSGKLTMSFPYSVGQIPVYYNHYNTGRPLLESNRNQKYISKYLDSPNEALYPFGYGLSYTTFEYSELELEQTTLSMSEELNIKVTVANTGQYAGRETVQLYVQDLYGSSVRPVKELKGFSSICLEPGAKKSVEFKLSEKDLRYYLPNGQFEAEAGDFKVYIGSDSRNGLVAEFKLVK